MSEQLWRELNQDTCLSDCAQVPTDERTQIPKPGTRTRTGDPQLIGAGEPAPPGALPLRYAQSDSEMRARRKTTAPWQARGA